MVPDEHEARRPDPDALLAQLEAEEARARRGKLRIFFGASPGVGKTYAMLNAARLLVSQGTEVVVGVAETHGRSETAQLLQGLEVIPQRPVEYRGHVLKEFDLDVALARKPALILVDELAHTNAPGSRHPKRWQDIEELLDAGIHVFTTLNVQHVESLNDVVGGITGIRVWETIPDHVFDGADDVVLVDLTPDELLQRLKEGKVYMPQQAERAIQNFFRKGNLLALREIALRRTADRVDEDVRAYRRKQAVKPVWPTRGSLLACVGPGPGGEKLVRSAARLADQLAVPWHAAYIETPRLQRLPDEERSRILRTLKLAQELGAQTATLPGQDAAASAASYAREHNLGRVLVGRDQEKRWPWRAGFAERLGRAAPELDIVQVAREGVDREAGVAAAPAQRRAIDWPGYALTAVAVAGVTVAATPLSDRLDLANIVMLFLLAVLFAAVKFGRGPAIFAAFLSVACFDFFFVPPRLTLAVSDVQYLLTFGVMLAVALTIGHLTSGLSFQAAVAQSRERRTRALYEMARELSAALTTEQIVEISGRFMAGALNARSTLLLPDRRDRLQAPGTEVAGVDPGIAQWAFDHGEEAGLGTDTLASSAKRYVPLKAPMRTRGVLTLAPEGGNWQSTPEQQRLLETSASLIAIALERVHYIEIAQEALLQMESERLRNSLLAALSHDLRTPLTVLVGLADSLSLAGPALPAAQADLAKTIREEAFRIGTLVNNLLD
ncbi:MAG TPA: DUF4118 domain-containing protein, partial [Burkholderiales bacterium]